MLSWQSQSVPVRTIGTGVKTAARTGFLASLSLGVQHIRTGSDHLLFLLMLLLPAPLAVRGRQWLRRDDLARAGWRVVHVVSAFAVGHSTTLLLGAVGLVHLPTRVIESGIALSVLVSAGHAIRPLVRAALATGAGLAWLFTRPAARGHPVPAVSAVAAVAAVAAAPAGRIRALEGVSPPRSPG